MTSEEGLVNTTRFLANFLNHLSVTSFLFEQRGDVGFFSAAVLRLLSDMKAVTLAQGDTVGMFDNVLFWV